MSTRMFIDGEWCDAASGATVEATSPATGESLGPVAEGDREDARRAIAAANAAFPAWAARTGFERAELLHRVADACERRLDELARILTLDQGKPLKAEAEVEVGELVEFLRMAAEDGKRVQGIIPESAAPGRRVLLLRRPLGVLGLITPWNWPYTMPAEVLAPALACGNTRRLDAGALDRRLLGRAGRVRRRGRPAAGRLQLGARPGPRGRRRAGGRTRHAGGRVHGLDRDRADGRAARGGQGAAARDGRQRPVRRAGGRRPARRRRTPRASAASSARARAAPPPSACSCTRRCARSSSALLAAEVEREVRLGDPLDGRDDDGAGQQRARRGEDGRARGRRGRARRHGRHRRQPAPTASRPTSTGSRRCSTASRRTRSRSRRRRSGRSRRSSASTRSRMRSSRPTRSPSG